MRNISAMQMVFANRSYVGLAVAISVGFFILFNTLDEYLFFSPILVFYVPPGAVTNFSLSIAITTLLGIVISMNVYMFEKLQVGLKGTSSWLSGSFIATATGVCGCTSLGFAVISTFGSAGILASSFLTNYQIPLKIASLAILFAAYYSVRKNMISTCINRKDNNR